MARHQKYWSEAMNAAEQFRGVIVPAVTPYLEDKRVDYAGVQRIFEYFGNLAEIDGIFVTGATGEYVLLDDSERRRIFDITAKLDSGKAIVPNTSTRLRMSTIELTEYARSIGFDTVGIIIPEDCRTFDSVQAFIEDLAKLEVSVFIYQTGNSPYPLSVEELGNLLSIGNVVGMKDSCSPKDMTRHLGYIRLYSDRINVIQGVEMLYLSSAVMGGVGVIGGGCNVYPSLLRRIGVALAAGNVEEARRLQDLVNEYVEIVYLEGSGNESMRYFLSLNGVDVGCTSRKDGVVVSDRKKGILRDLHAKLQCA